MLTRLPRCRAFHGDERGQIAFLAVLSLLVVFMFFGFALDAGIWYFDHRTIQNQADAAAHAGAAEIADAVAKNVTTQQIKDASRDAAETALARNGLSAPRDQACGPPGWFLAEETVDGPWHVTVCLTRRTPAFFSRLAGVDSVTVSARAVAEYGTPLPYRLIAMNRVGCNTLDLEGATVTVKEAGVYVGSDGSACPPGGSPLRVVGSRSFLKSTTRAGTVTNDVVDATDPWCSGSITPACTEAAPPIGDPWADLEPPPRPPGPCIDLGPINVDTPLSPGRPYCNLVITGGKITLEPGVYYLEGGMTVSTNDGFRGQEPEGVLFYSLGDISITSDGNLDLLGRQEYEDILFWAPTASVVIHGASAANGNRYRGHIYAPSSEVTLASGADVRADMTVLADRIKIRGIDITLESEPGGFIVTPPIRRQVVLVH